ncbi:FMN-dependent NADH-azoreductase [Roseobacter ponti]|uniref:FMN dependent NADH:quinone oxidoreductase n=1 Tax=Roseobacter ponti TaxID=1891787 RepID=A0A858T0C5_9RHOB|nr:NAD(P)H-dependent oxidoreductase [Roseobacter ponti]QJF52646.1 FMN-dependent NADH-azoreductase [Roseobacter ponti]
MTQKILHIDASARLNGSVSRQLSAEVVDRLGGDVTHRDLAEGIPQITEAWVSATFTPADQRTDDQRNALSFSDELVGEIMEADVLVIGTPVYNFAPPAALKAWIDQIARAGVTFRYTENGPVGLLEGKRAVIVLATGGTAIGSEIDFASGYLRHMMGFIGIHDVEIIAADRLMADADTALSSAKKQIRDLAA